MQKEHDVDESPPIPAPVDPPPEEECEDQPELSEIEPKSSKIKKIEHHYRVTVVDVSRKFTVKTYGSQALALFASEKFESLAYNMLLKFDGMNRQPDERKKLLRAAGCNEKFTSGKPRIWLQRADLLRQMCNGGVAKIEQDILDSICKKLGGNMDTTGFSLKIGPTGFSASYQGAKHLVERSFSTVIESFDWMKSMAIAEKAGLCNMQDFYTNTCYNKLKRKSTCFISICFK